MVRGKIVYIGFDLGGVFLRFLFLSPKHYSTLSTYSVKSDFCSLGMWDNRSLMKFSLSVRKVTEARGKKG